MVRVVPGVPDRDIPEETAVRPQDVYRVFIIIGSNFKGRTDFTFVQIHIPFTCVWFYNHLVLAMLLYGHFSSHLEFIYTDYVVYRS